MLALLFEFAPAAGNRLGSFRSGQAVSGGFSGLAVGKQGRSEGVFGLLVLHGGPRLNQLPQPDESDEALVGPTASGIGFYVQKLMSRHCSNRWRAAGG